MSEPTPSLQKKNSSLSKRIRPLLPPELDVRKGDIDTALEQVVDALDVIGIELDVDKFETEEYKYQGVLIKTQSKKGLQVEIHIHPSYRDKTLNERRLLSSIKISAQSESRSDINHVVLHTHPDTGVEGRDYRNHLEEILGKLSSYFRLLNIGDLKLQRTQRARKEITRNPNHYTFPLVSPKDKPQLELLFTRNMHRVALVITPQEEGNSKIMRIQIESSIYYKSPQITVFSKAEKSNIIALRLEMDMDPARGKPIQAHIYEIEEDSLGSPKIIVVSPSSSQRPVPLYRSASLLADLEKVLGGMSDMSSAVGRIFESL